MRIGESRVIAAVADAALRAQIVRRRPMRYAGGADPRHDRPAHVRAASGVVWAGKHLAVIQDDASFLALVDSATGLAHSVPLPASPGGARQFDDTRRNKAKKLNLEALRERDRVIAVVDSDDHARASDLLEIAIGGPWSGERQ